ncbi:sensor histidine kinase [Psychrobacter jeotgali]|uniref:sensor histidine kinase n=1 Tax=Psychrobacter jeotgali TaxID=179010 RepID=UPI00191AA764|nr:sensor histidine kinase [Psychrobacter jeotgali]
MQQLGFRSVFAKLFASVMLALILFAVAMVLLTQLVHDKDASNRSEVVAGQILGQVDPFLNELNVAISNDNRLQARFMLAVIKKSFDIFDESLQAKMGLYDNNGHLLMQTDNSDLPLELPETPSLLMRAFPSFSDTPVLQQAQVYSSTGYTLLYESRLPPKKPVLSAALNLFTGTLLLLIIMAGVLWWIARSMTWQINQMSQQMNQLGDGDFSVRVNASGNDEIALLARGFNQAAQKIEHLIDANNLLLAHASHELRTPITRIRLQIEMMDMLASVMPADTKAKFDKRAQAINRDLSGLNDLVESILLVSRLDAGHAMQQVEKLDLYELINQERQHYSETTLIGEHIVIDGQAPMLTHLIRNLLNNALLHGEPPVTILLYGVQTLEEADNVPDYLLQSIVSSSFADIDYSCLDYNGYDASNNDDKDSANKAEENTTTLPSPTIYYNGETLSSNDLDQYINQVESNSPVENEANSNDKNANIDPIVNAKQNLNSTSPEKEPISKADSSKTSSFKVPVVSDDLFINHYHKFTAELIEKIKKVSWKVVADKTEQAPTLAQTVNDYLGPSDDTLKDSPKNDSKNHKESETEAAKEGLFKKHLSKSKASLVPPAPKYAVMAVIDEGEGIPEEKRQEIFSPFVRLQQKNKGSGLGLSLVSQIVTAHQGHILTDTINGHTRFLVILPVQHNPHLNQRDHNRNHLLNSRNQG